MKIGRTRFAADEDSTRLREAERKHIIDFFEILSLLGIASAVATTATVGAMTAPVGGIFLNNFFTFLLFYDC